MPDDRPPISRPLQRDVLVEAGHRCAIPTCKMTPVEIAHIVPWSDVLEHTFDNLIALCPTCHTRYDRGEIDRLAMRRYKANLALISNRYGEIERRVLQTFADNPDAPGVVLPFGLDIMLMYLLRDGLIETPDDPVDRALVTIEPWRAHQVYSLTQKGREFVRRWTAADLVE